MDIGQAQPIESSFLFFQMAQIFSFLSIGFVYVSTITFVMEVKSEHAQK